MIYPKNFESKIGFDEIRRLLKGLCLSTLGQEKVDEIAFSDEASVINEHLEQIREFRRMLQNTENWRTHIWRKKNCGTCAVRWRP